MAVDAPLHGAVRHNEPWLVCREHIFESDQDKEKKEAKAWSKHTSKSITRFLTMNDMGFWVNSPERKRSAICRWIKRMLTQMTWIVPGLAHRKCQVRVSFSNSPQGFGLPKQTAVRNEHGQMIDQHHRNKRPVARQSIAS
jgi:hypothetical protein